MGYGKIPPMRHSGSWLAPLKFRCENEPYSDHHIRFGENSETRSARQRFA